MDVRKLLEIIETGEGHSIEFKKSTNEITKDVYDTVCSFSNREGGHILLGVSDDGDILGVEESAVEKIKKDFVTAINNANKLYPPLYLQMEGITVAAILLFGKDSTIMSVLPQHKTDAIFRVENVDRYDDRDVIITNLIETYDRLVEFGQKHLSDPFVQEGLHSVSARDKILREIFSNSLAHRDYSSGYVAKFVIEKDKMFTENANRSHGNGALNLSNFEPYAKNPAISKVFRELALADELGSGMRNTYKYTKLYSGGEPAFIEGDVFRTIVPLNDVSIGIVGPKNVALDVAPDDALEMTLEEVILQNIASNNKITRNELAEIAGVSKKTIERKLKGMPNIKYVGTGRHGYWEVKRM